MGDENYDHRRLTEVSKIADVHRFINNLQLGYDQIVSAVRGFRVDKSREYALLAHYIASRHC